MNPNATRILSRAVAASAYDKVDCVFGFRVGELGRWANQGLLSRFVLGEAAQTSRRPASITTWLRCWLSPRSLHEHTH